MRPDMSAEEVLELSFWLGPQSSGADSLHAWLADCIEDLRPLIFRHSNKYSDTRQIFALSAIIVEMAIESGDNARVAMLLRNCAGVLELDAREAYGNRH